MPPPAPRVGAGVIFWPTVATAGVALIAAPQAWPYVVAAALAALGMASLRLRQLILAERALERERAVEGLRQEGERRALERDRDRLQSILGAMSEGVMVLDSERRIQLANPSARMLLDLSPRLSPGLGEGEPFGQPGALTPTESSPSFAGAPSSPSLSGSSNPTTPPTLLDVIRLPLLHALAERGLAGERAAEEIALPNNRQVLVRTAPLKGSTLDSAVLVFNDVSDLRRLEAVRRDLVANVSHELRTPLTAIRGYAETLQDGGLDNPTQAQEFIAIILRHAERLSRLLDDLLELSRLEAGSRPLRSEPVNLMPLVVHSLDLVRPKASSRQVDLSVEVADGPDVLGDAEALEQVLVNLLDNAVKYTREGGRVVLQAHTEGSGAKARWHIAVRDNGIGIEATHLTRVFERFYRVDPGRSRDMGGTGLGLAIVKHLSQAMGGRVGVQSEAGKGSTFWVEMPIAQNTLPA